MVFGINLQELGRTEILKVDANKNGIPDAVEGIDAFQAGAAKVQPFLDRIDEGDIRLLLQALNVGNKFTSDELDEFAEGTVQTLRAVPELVKISQQVEDFLKGSKKK